jgi:stage V sporulation protein B
VSLPTAPLPAADGDWDGRTTASSPGDPQAGTAGGFAARGIVQGVAGRSISFACAYLATIVLARRLGPEGYGLYGVVISVLLWMEQTARFTVPPAAAKLIPQDPQASRAVQETGLVVGSLLFFALFGAFWLAAGPLATLFGLPAEGAWLFRVAALDLPIFGVYVVYRGILQGHHDFLTLSIADVIYTAGKLLAVVALLAVSLSVASALVANVAASVGALLFVAARISIKIRRPEAVVTRALLALALPLGLYMLALQTITNLDLWSLQMLNDGAPAASTVGVYVAARNLAVVPGVILMVVSDVMLPSLSRALAGGETRLPQLYLQGAMRFLCILLAPIVLVLMVGADDLMSWLYSGTFRSGGMFVRVLILYAISLPFMDLFASAMSAKGEPYRGGLTLLLMIPMAIAVNVVLVRRYGAVGAAYGSAAAGLISAAVLGVFVGRRFGSLMTFRTCANLVVATGLMILAAAQLASLHSRPALTVTVGLVVYGASLIVLKELRANDLLHFAFWKWRTR